MHVDAQVRGAHLELDRIDGQVVIGLQAQPIAARFDRAAHLERAVLLHVDLQALHHLPTHRRSVPPARVACPFDLEPGASAARRVEHEVAADHERVDREAKIAEVVAADDEGARRHVDALRRRSGQPPFEGESVERELGLLLGPRAIDSPDEATVLVGLHLCRTAHDSRVEVRSDRLTGDRRPVGLEQPADQGDDGVRDFQRRRHLLLGLRRPCHFDVP